MRIAKGEGMSALFGAVVLTVVSAPGQVAPLVGRAALAGGSTVEGHLRGDVDAGFSFVAASRPVPVSLLKQIDYPARLAVYPLAGPSRRIRLAGGEVVTGTILEWGPQSVRVNVRGFGEAAIPRPAIAAVETPVGEADVVYEDCSGDASAWSAEGGAGLVFGTPPTGGRALDLTASAATVRYAPEDPIGAGCAGVSVFAERGADWRIAFEFRRAEGGESASLVASEQEGRYLVTARGLRLDRPPVAATAGWRRVTLVVRDGRMLLLAGDHVIATGNASVQGLEAIRLMHGLSGEAGEGISGGNVWIDDLIVRRETPVPESDLQPAFALDEDCVVLSSGDRLFGSVRWVDGRHVRCQVGGSEIAVPWSTVRRVVFAEANAPTAPVSGLICRVRLQRSALDRSEGAPDEIVAALVAASATEFEIDHPDLGRLRVPATHVRRIEPVYFGTRQWITRAHRQSGNAVRDDSAQAAPGGPSAAGEFRLESLPPGKAYIRASVAELWPCGPDAPPATPYLAHLRRGELVTSLAVNAGAGTALNELISYRSTPHGRRQDVRVAIPDGVLRAGTNTWRLVQHPAGAGTPRWNDCEIGPLVLEVETPHGAGADSGVGRGVQASD